MTLLEKKVLVIYAFNLFSYYLLAVTVVRGSMVGMALKQFGTVNFTSVTQVLKSLYEVSS